MTRNPIIRAWFGPGEISAVLFAGLGGQSLGERHATGRGPDIAVNHWPVAIAAHAANFPETKHYVENVYDVAPLRATGGRPVALLWLSPDCTHHSKAKGGKPRDQKIRGLAWSAIPWAKDVRPRVIMLENVPEFLDWGPLGQDGQPIEARKGQTFRAWVRKLEALGYVVEWKKLRACDYGAPTTRTRLFVIARCDGRPISWPTPTHGPLLLPYLTAASCIDWDITCPSIFTRERPLADKTLARIARGIRKFVLESARPFILPVKSWGGGGNEPSSIDQPLRTVTGSKRGEFAIAVPYLVHRGNGERVGQTPRTYDATEPFRTVVGQGEKFALCAAFLAKHYGGNESTQGGSALDRAIDTITGQDHHALVAANLIRYNGDLPGAERVADINAPLTTEDTSRRFALVASFLSRYNGQSVGQRPDNPLGTVDATDRYGLVTVTIDGEQYAIVDIGMRMLTPRELFRAQGFPDSVVIDPVWNGKPISKTDQIKLCGNSVPPAWSEALIAANFSEAA